MGYKVAQQAGRNRRWSKPRSNDEQRRAEIRKDRGRSFWIVSDSFECQSARKWEEELECMEKIIAWLEEGKDRSRYSTRWHKALSSQMCVHCISNLFEPILFVLAHAPEDVKQLASHGLGAFGRHKVLTGVQISKHVFLTFPVVRKFHIPATSARVKSYQFVKVVSGGRAPGKSSSLASPQLLVIERFQCFALFRYPNFQTWSETISFQHFWLRNVLRATTVGIFSTFQLPKVVQEWCALYWLQNVLRATACNFSSLIWPDGSAPAALASLLFDPVPQISRKTQRVATVLPFRAPSSSFFWPFLLWSSLFCSSLLWLCTPLLFHVSVLSGVWPLNFLRSVYGRIHAWLFLCDDAWLREVVDAYACTHAWQSLDIFFPVVPRKGVAEVSKIGHYRGGELLWCMDGRANPLMDQKVVGVFFLEWLPSGCTGCSGHLPTTAGCSVV